ncbi:hypothetical protein D3C72_1885640 [compost metagenome]
MHLETPQLQQVIAESGKQHLLIEVERHLVHAAVQADKKIQPALRQFEGDAHQVVEVIAAGKHVDRLYRVGELAVPQHSPRPCQGVVGEAIEAGHVSPFIGERSRQVNASVHPATGRDAGTDAGHLPPPG